MKEFKYDMGSAEREVLAFAILDDRVLGSLVSKWETGGLFSSPYANMVAGWCIDFFKNHGGSAPGKQVISLFRSWSDTDHRRKEEIETIDQFLSGLEYKQEINANHAVHLAGIHFRKVKLRKTLELASAHLDAGHLDKAETALSKHSIIQMADDAGVDLFNDLDEIASTFTEETESIVKYNIPAIDRFMGPLLEREGFIAFLAPNKTGKSFWLMDFAWRAAVENRRKVAFFLVGDMSKKQYKRRFYARCAQHPYKSPNGEWPYTIDIPDSLTLRWGSKGNIVADVPKSPITFDDKLDVALAYKACTKIVKRDIKSFETYLKFAGYPGRGVSTAGIRSKLRQWATEGFRPDILCIDYADNLAPLDSRADKRDQVNDTWLDLSAIRLENHCLLVTATQADSASFNKGILTRENFSEDRRKLDHVTGIIGLNVSAKEKGVGITRLNWPNSREGEFSDRDMCWVAGSLALCNPAMVASFPRGGDRIEGEQSNNDDDDNSDANETFNRNGKHKQRGRI